MKTRRICILLIAAVFLLGCANRKEGIEEEQTFDDHESMNDSDDENIGMFTSKPLDEEQIITEQSFFIDLSDFGNVRFVSYRPESANSFTDVSFYLTKNDQVIYEFPYYYENNTSNYLFSDVEAVAFRDVNGDEKEDVILIINYIFGAGPQGMIPRPEVRIYLAPEKCFYLSEEINNTIQNTLADLGEEVTIDKVYEFIAGVFGSSKAD